MEAVRRLGSYLYRFEWLPRLFFRVYALIQDNPSLEDFTIRLATAAALASIAAPLVMTHQCCCRYITDVFGRSPKHTMNYFRMFLELDAHSCYHLLPTIQTPSNVFSPVTAHIPVSNANVVALLPPSLPPCLPQHSLLVATWMC